jgi:cellulase (glycosyl hydrolase family 5)
MRRTLLLATALCSSLTAIATAACVSPPASAGKFGILNGTIYDPNQQPFIARGIGVIHGAGDPSAAQIQAAFPGTNFIRLAIYNYDSPQSLASEVTDFTSHGMVVELENHNNGAGNAGGSQGSVFTGQALSNESAWYASVAKAFANNPKVWFGTENEPPGSGSALADWQMATYQAIRGAGNDAPILLEVNGWADTSSFGSGSDNAVYKQMTNVIADVHMYGWLTNYNTNQATNDQFVAGAIAATQRNIVTGGGIIPVIIGEYGNSTTGVGIDPNGSQIVAAVDKSGVGSAAWAWGSGNPGDGLTRGDGFGQQVANFIKASPVASTAIAGCPTAPLVTSPSQITATIPPTTPANIVLPAPMVNNPPPSVLSDDPPLTGYVPWYPQGGPSSTPATITDTSIPVTPSAPPIQAQANLIAANPPDPLSQASWWTDNPVARAAEQSLCGSPENTGADLWLQYCGVAH